MLRSADPNLAALRGRPLGFLFHYVRRHPTGHAIVLLSVLFAVACSVTTQYGMKHLIDIVSTGQAAGGPRVWGAFLLLCGLVAADNLLWRVGGYAAHRTFVAVTGDVRRDLFAHLSGHAPSYFAERLPGSLASRISATANAAFTLENTGVWNVIPPCLGVLFSIAFIGSVNPPLALTLSGIATALGLLIFALGNAVVGKQVLIGVGHLSVRLGDGERLVVGADRGREVGRIHDRQGLALLDHVSGRHQ